MKRALALLFLLGAAFVALGYWNAVQDPLVREARLALPGWPKDAKPLRVALVSDIHAQGPDMTPARVARLMEQVNAQHPDLILLAGDLTGDRDLATSHYTPDEIAGALAGLRAPLGVWAVLGNHDHWADAPAMRRALEARNIHVLANSAARVGPLTLAGADDAHSRHDNIPATDRAAAALPGPLLLLTHSPDLIPRLPSRFGLVFAGHTHCGQAVLPLIGTLVSSSRYGKRYECGLIHEGGRTIVVTSGLGTSVVPLRYGAPPDFWLVTLGG